MGGGYKLHIHINAPINVYPHLPIPGGAMVGLGGDLQKKQNPHPWDNFLILIPSFGLRQR